MAANLQHRTPKPLRLSPKVIRDPTAAIPSSRRLHPKFWRIKSTPSNRAYSRFVSPWLLVLL